MTASPTARLIRSLDQDNPCVRGRSACRDSIKILKYHISKANAAVMPALTAASGRRKWASAICGTEDKSPRKIELVQIIAGDILKRGSLIAGKFIDIVTAKSFLSGCDDFSPI